MNNEEYRKAIDEVIYLSGCVVNGNIPDKERISDINLDHLYQAAKKHMMEAIVGYALEKAGISDEKFIQARAKSIRKITLMDIEKNQIIKEMEKEKIWYAPLKGIVIKDLYPSIGLRQMADYDILFDEACAEKVQKIMLGIGFTCEEYGERHHDTYFKKPVCNFEMHKSLFGTYFSFLYDYYSDIRKKLLKDENNQYGYHFSDEDFYIHLVAHEYKHYADCGMGLRSLLDIYVFWQKYDGRLDTDYIAMELKKLGIDDFEQEICTLASKMFSQEPLTESETKMFEYIVFSGTYGTIENRIERKVKKNGGGKKGKYYFLIRKVILPMDEVKICHPFYYKHKILLPILPFYRVIRAFTVKRKETKEKLKALKKIK